MSIQPPGFSSYQPVRIIYNNDLHEHWDALPSQVSAFSQLSEQAKSTGTDVFRINSGDSNTGTEANEWLLMVDVLNRLRLHATTPGNHEFDLRPDQYIGPLHDKAAFPTLVSNVTLPQSLLPPTVPLSTHSMVLEGENGRYGFIGITRPAETSRIVPEMTAMGITPLTFMQTVAQVQRMVDSLEQRGIQQVVVISHMGSILDRLLARHTRGIDVIVGGDSHDALHGVQPGNTLLNGKDGQPVLVMQAGCNGQWVGVADLVFDNQGHLFQAKNQLIPSRTFPADGDTEQLIAKAIGEKQVIVQLTTPYNNDGIRTQNDPVAQLAADAMRMATSADIAFVRSREIRESLPAGPLTNWALKTLMPYANPVVVLPVSGEEIIQSLSRAAYGIGHPLGKPSPLLHPSGLTATLDPETGKVSHARVLSWKTGQWSPVEPKTMYIVALGEYAVRNRNPGEFPELAHPERITHNTGLSLRDFFTQALTNLSPDGRPVVIPPAQPRLTIQQ